MSPPDELACANPAPTTWALGIATYNRRDVLLDCLRLAAEQSRPPAEIIVVDASSDWDVTRQAVMEGLAPQYPAIQWCFEKARMASAAAQRNQCLELATAQVLFLFDDDSLMYRDCAEKIMRLYELDTEGEIVGVSAMLAPRPPQESAMADDAGRIEAERAAPTKDNRSGLMTRLRKLLKADMVFVPYDEQCVMRELPAKFDGMGYGYRDAMAGMTMTVRRGPAMQERFDEVIRDRGPEDNDLSCRLLRHGAIGTVLDAMIFHVGSPAGRFSAYSREATDRMGPLVLHRLNAKDLDLSKRLNRATLRRRLFVGFLKDLKGRQWHLPYARGAWIALRYINKIYAMEPVALRAWYPKMQLSLRETGKPLRD